MIGSLFSGIGGLELGLEWAGLGPVLWQVEKDPFCQAVLARHWPHAQRFEDVCTVGPSVLRRVRLICGGFPCQDLSFAGKGAGLAGTRSSLWWEYARIIRDMGPAVVVVENVPGIRSRGLDAVLGTLAALGYDAEWHSFRASDVGAPHRRERVFVIAWSVANPNRGRWEELGSGGILDGEREAFRDHTDGRDGAGVADAEGTRWPVRRGASGEHTGWARLANDGRRPVEPSMGREPHGIPAQMDRWPARPGKAQHEWEAPRTVEQAVNRAARLRALGNAVLPQVVADRIGPRVIEILQEYA